MREARQYLKAVRRHNWKTGKDALFPKSKIQPPGMETMRIRQLNQQRETELLRQQLEKAQREQELAQEGTQDLQQFISNLMNEKEAIQEQTKMLKQELIQQQNAQSQEQQERRRQEQLTQSELYELRVKLQKQEGLLLRTTQFQTTAPIGLQQAFFTPETQSEEIKTQLFHTKTPDDFQNADPGLILVLFGPFPILV